MPAPPRLRGYNARMDSLVRRVARFLLCITLFTVLTPCFGWEAAGGAASHEHTMAAVQEGHGDHGDACPMMADQHHQQDGDDSQGPVHHGCAGHQLGHLLGTIEEGHAPILPRASSHQPLGHAMAYLTYIPPTLERPPRHCA